MFLTTLLLTVMSAPEDNFCGKMSNVVVCSGVAVYIMFTILLCYFSGISRQTIAILHPRKLAVYALTGRFMPG